MNDKPLASDFQSAGLDWGEARLNLSRNAIRVCRNRLRNLFRNVTLRFEHFIAFLANHSLQLQTEVRIRNSSVASPLEQLIQQSDCVQSLSW